MRNHEIRSLTGVGPETLRFYERQGLLVEGVHFDRVPAGHRRYREAAVERLELVRLAKSAGITVRELATWADDWERGTLSARQKADFFRRRILEVEARVRDLELVAEHLRGKLADLGDVAET
jgi:DNA-binding transcriptional MerR regulator